VVKEYVDPEVPLKANEALLMLIHKKNLVKLDKNIIL
jgi:trk system potassium uptake protein TrkA